MISMTGPTLSCPSKSCPPVWLRWLSLAGLTMAACSSDPEPETQPISALASNECPDRFQVQATASDSTRQATGGVATFRAQVGERFVVSLFDEGGASLGEVETIPNYEFGKRDAWEVRVVYRNEGEIRASQINRFRLRPDGRVGLETEQRLGDRRFFLWSVLDPDFELAQASLGVEAQAGEPGAINTGAGFYRRVPLVAERDGAINVPAVEDFIAAEGLDAFEESADFQRLLAGSGSPDWGRPIEAAADLCETAETNVALSGAAAGLSAVKRGGGLRRSASGLDCGDPGPFGRVIEIRSILKAAGAGIAITSALIAAGVVATPTAIAATVVVSGVAAYFVAQAISRAVNDNRRGVVAVLSSGVSAIQGEGIRPNQEAVDFFGGSESRGGSSGDPHLDTFDGRAFDFQSAGEFVLVRDGPAAPGGFEIQVRQEPVDGICSQVAINTAVAVRLGSSVVVLDQAGGIRLDGSPIEPLPSGTELPDGARVIRVGDDRVALRLSDGTGALVDLFGRAVDVDVYLASDRVGRVEGLLGDADGDPSGDFRYPDGRLLATPTDWTELHGPFADAWRVAAGSSLFEYGPDESPETFVIEGFPARPTRVDDLPMDARSDAESTCRERGVPEDGAALEDCVLDVACTGDAGFADSHIDRPGNEREDLRFPVQFDTWTQEGVPEAGDWTPSPDGRAVRQRVNGDPTFFVSDRDYLDVNLRGTIQVTSGDDDFIGVAFGYRGPLQSEGDGPRDYDMLLLSWKGESQGSGDFFANEGLTLTRLQGTIPAERDVEIFWGGTETAEQTVLATDYGDGKGWNRDQEYDLAITYAQGGIRVRVDDRTVFDLPAAELPFAVEPGRFAFYNYSQPGTRYSNFSAVQATYLPPSAGACAGLLQDGFERSGVYGLPEAPGVQVYCDMETDGGGWTLVFKRPGGGLAGNAYTEWRDGPMGEGDLSLLNPEFQGRVYRSGLVDSWGAFNEARVEVVDEGEVAQFVRFDTQGSSSEDWFAPDRWVESSWTDLPNDADFGGGSGQFFSIDGPGENGGRFWYVNNNWGGCSNDAGWLLFAHSTRCFWEGEQDTGGALMYSPGPTRSSAQDYRYADGLRVWVR